MSSSARTAFPTSGVTCCPRARRDRVVGFEHVVLQEVLRDPHQTLRRDPDVPDVLDIHQLEQPRLEAFGRDVGHVATGHDDVAHLGGRSQVVEHRAPAVVLLHLELVLQDLQRVVAHEVHPGAVAAVLRARRDQLGEDLRGIPMGEPLDGPHVGLVQRVA